jgi:hypothetical protein
MKKLTTLLSLLVLVACNDNERVNPLRLPLKGTYNVTHLTQYQDGKLVFEHDLPALIDGKMTIKHAMTIDLSTLKSSSTDAFVGYNTLQSWGNYSRSYGRPIANNQIKLETTQDPATFDFYDGTGTFLGNCNGKTLSFDFTVPDSLGHPVRYVYKAEKTSSSPSHFTFPD